MLAMRNHLLKLAERSDFAGHYISEHELRTMLNETGFRNVQVLRNRIEVFGVCLK